MILLLTVFLAFPAIITALTMSGLNRVSAGEDSLPGTSALAWSYGGAVLSLALLPTGISLGHCAILTALFATLAIGTYCDRETGWAPDAVVLSATILAMMAGSAKGAWDLPAYQAVLAGIVIFLVIQGTWIAISHITPAASALPPGDLIALLLPLLALGVGFEFVFAMMLNSLILILCLASPPLRRIFSKDEVASGAMKDLEGQGGVALDRPAVTFLTVGLPVCGTMVAAGLI